MPFRDEETRECMYCNRSPCVCGQERDEPQFFETTSESQQQETKTDEHNRDDP